MTLTWFIDLLWLKYWKIIKYSWNIESWYFTLIYSSYLINKFDKNSKSNPENLVLVSCGLHLLMWNIRMPNNYSTFLLWLYNSPHYYYHHVPIITCHISNFKKIMKYAKFDLEYSHQLSHKKCHYNTSKTFFIILVHHFTIHHLSHLLFFNSIY